MDVKQKLKFMVGFFYEFLINYETDLYHLIYYLKYKLLIIIVYFL